MKKILLNLFLLTYTFTTFSQTVSVRILDNIDGTPLENIKLENIELKALYTPGHTDCSYSYIMNDRVFTGDTLLINGTGRTDFQNGSSKDAYHSLFHKLLKLPEETILYPGHDYNGKKSSTIGKEKEHNPRLQVENVDQYIEIMSNLNLLKPKMIDHNISSILKLG